MGLSLANWERSSGEYGKERLDLRLDGITKVNSRRECAGYKGREDREKKKEEENEERGFQLTWKARSRGYVVAVSAGDLICQPTVTS